MPSDPNRSIYLWQQIMMSHINSDGQCTEYVFMCCCQQIINGWSVFHLREALTPWWFVTLQRTYIMLPSWSRRYNNVYSQDTSLRNLSHLTVLTHLFAVTRRQPNKANSYSKRNSRVSHYGCTYIQDCHMAFSCIAFPLNTHAAMPSNLIQGQRNKGSSCIHVQRMETCQHEKLLEENTVVFFY